MPELRKPRSRKRMTKNRDSSACWIEDNDSYKEATAAGVSRRARISARQCSPTAFK